MNKKRKTRSDREEKMSGRRGKRKTKKRAEWKTIPKWMLPAAAYLCFVAELIFIIMGNIDHGIIFAGLCFCLVIVFFVLWREEQTHKLLALQSSLDDALRREEQERAGKEHERIRRLQKEKEELVCESKQAQREWEKLARENEGLKRRMEEAIQRERSVYQKEASERILPPDENPSELDLVTVVADVAARMEDACRKAGIRLRVSCANAGFPYRADERFIRLILHNIIDNAIQYMCRSGSLIITLSHLGNHVFLAFKDDGMGLAGEETDHIFELNYQGSNSTRGSGLGLAQVKAIVCHLGGVVSARSTDGMGIYIQLPLSRETGDGRGGTQEEKTGETGGEGNGANEDTAGGR